MTKPMSDERLAEILWEARKRTLGYDAATFPLGEMPANQREQYRRFAAEVAAQLDQDRDAEVARLRAKLDQPCGMCHPCTNWADETWRRAGRKPPHVHQWDELKAGAQRVYELHTPDENGECTSCHESFDPCSTIRALDGSEAGR